MKAVKKGSRAEQAEVDAKALAEWDKHDELAKKELAEYARVKTTNTTKAEEAAVAVLTALFGDSSAEAPACGSRGAK